MKIKTDFWYNQSIKEWPIQYARLIMFIGMILFTNTMYLLYIQNYILMTFNLIPLLFIIIMHISYNKYCDEQQKMKTGKIKIRRHKI